MNTLMIFRISKTLVRLTEFSNYCQNETFKCTDTLTLKCFSKSL